MKIKLKTYFTLNRFSFTPAFPHDKIYKFTDYNIKCIVLCCVINNTSTRQNFPVFCVHTANHKVIVSCIGSRKWESTLKINMCDLLHLKCKIYE